MIQRLHGVTIPDLYQFMDPQLVALLQNRAAPHLVKLTGARPYQPRRSP
jgi:predicted protein tyrosine phosphatase